MLYLILCSINHPRSIIASIVLVALTIGFTGCGGPWRDTYLKKGVGRLTQVSDASGSISIVYDSRGNVTKETRVIGAQTYVTEYGYDAADNLIQVVCTNAASGSEKGWAVISQEET